MRPGHDGVTRVLFKLVEHLKQNDVPSIFFSPIVPDVTEQPVPMVKIPSVAFPLYPDYRLALPGFKSFERRLLEFKPDVLHINSPCSLGYAAVKFGEKHGIPVVATYHTHFPSYARYYKLLPLEQFGWQYFRGLYNNCSRLLVPSRAISEELAGHGINNLQVLPHGVDCDVFNPAWKREDWKQRHGLDGRTILLFAGRLVWEKNLRVLAESWNMLKNRHHNIAMVLAGDGPARQELQSLMPDALFLGQQNGNALSETFASSDVFVFPSVTETFGNVVIEAMASGIAPVCAAQGGPAGVIDHGRTGLLAAPNDATDFANRISQVIDDPGQRNELAEAGLAHARSQTWSAIFARTMESYRDVIASFAHRKLASERKAA
jgi:glycosyltransferase involved in cell wall biosynthesis